MNKSVNRSTQYFKITTMVAVNPAYEQEDYIATLNAIHSSVRGIVGELLSHDAIVKAEEVYKRDFECFYDIENPLLDGDEI